MTLTVDLCCFQLKIVTPLTPALGNVYANFDFSTLFCFRVTSPYGTDGRTERLTDTQTDGRTTYDSNNVHRAVKTVRLGDDDDSGDGNNDDDDDDDDDDFADVC